MQDKQDTPSVFRSGKKTFQADTCRPVVDAVSAGEIEMHSFARGSYPGKRLRKGELEGVRTFGYLDARGPQHHGLPFHRNEGIEFTTMLSGEMPMAVGKFRGTLKPGYMMITRPWQAHRLGNPNFGYGRMLWLIIDVGIRHPHQVWNWPPWIILDTSDLVDLTRYLSHNEEPLRLIPPAMADTLNRLCSVCNSADQPGFKSKTSVLINNMLLQLLENFRASNIRLRPSIVSAERTVKLFAERLNDSLRQQWTVETMAEACELGTTRFTHYFRQITNETPSHFLGRLRLDCAEKMLKEKPDLNLTDLAKECGFTRVNHFIYAFKCRHGCSPGRYRTLSNPH